MIAQKHVLAVAPQLQYVHHVKILNGDPHVRLPVVTETALYQLNQTAGDKSTYLAACRPEAYEYDAERFAAVFLLKAGFKNKPPEACVQWKVLEERNQDRSD